MAYKIALTDTDLRGYFFVHWYAPEAQAIVKNITSYDYGNLVVSVELVMVSYELK